MFKIHPLDYKKSFSYLNYFKKNHKHLKIITHQKNLETLMSQSRLSVFLFGHRFLKNLSISRPSIAIIPSQLMKVLTSEGIKSLKHLVEAKVVFYNFDYARKFLVENYDKVDQWWLNNYTITD